VARNIDLPDGLGNCGSAVTFGGRILHFFTAADIEVLGGSTTEVNLVEKVYTLRYLT
jgi:hypothetical protein